MGDGIPQVIMDWKEVQQRLNRYQLTDLVQKQGQFTKPSGVYKTEKLKELWDLCHEDRETSFRSLIQQVGFSGRADYTHIKNWFLKRGWGEMPARIDPTEKYSEEIYNHHKKGLSATQISLGSIVSRHCVETSQGDLWC